MDEKIDLIDFENPPSKRRAQSAQGLIERVFERALWESRLVIIIAVVACALMSFGTFFIAAVDAVYLFKTIVAYADFTQPSDVRETLRSQTITLIVKTLDSFLIAAILIIFALGLYELFINRLDAARKSEVAEKLLRTRTLDDLKQRIAGLLLLVLVIEFFQQALRFNYQTPLDLLYLAVAILLISAAFYLSSLRSKGDGGEK